MYVHRSAVQRGADERTALHGVFSLRLKHVVVVQGFQRYVWFGEEEVSMGILLTGHYTTAEFFCHCHCVPVI